MEKLITIGNYQVNVQWLRFQNPDPHKPILVFLHEALGSIPQWKSFPLQLCEDLQLPGIIIERSGHGKSSPLQSARDERYLHNYADECQQVLVELLEPKQPVLLVGHSDGGTIALLMALKPHFPISGIITMAAHTFVEPETLNGIAPAVEAFEQGKLKGLIKFHGEKTNELFYAWANTWRAPFFLNWDIRKEIATLKLPVLALQGADDQYGTPLQFYSITEHNSLAESYLIPACGHHPHLEKTMDTIHLIHHWYHRNFK